MWQAKQPSYSSRATVSLVPKGTGTVFGFLGPKAPEIQESEHRPSQSQGAAPRQKEPSRLDTSAQNDAQIVGFVLSQGEKGASLADIHLGTGLPIKYLRTRTWRLRGRGKLRTEGTTSQAKYFGIES